MKMLARAALVLAGLLVISPADAAPKVALCSAADGTTLFCNGTQESLTLASANTAAASQTVYGGTYIFAQLATAGTVALQVLGPDGATWETVISKTSADTTGGTAISLQGGAVVRVLLTSTTGAVATLSRVP